jgi:hypothetical protein
VWKSQNQFPNDAIEVSENGAAGLVAKIVHMIERHGPANLNRFVQENDAAPA